MSSKETSQSMEPHDFLKLANVVAAKGNGDALSLLLSSASDLFDLDITGEKAKARTKKNLATYTPNQVPPSSSSAPMPVMGSSSRPTSPTAIRPTTAPTAASSSS